MGLARAELKGNLQARHDALKTVEKRISETMALADLLGRRQTLRESDRIFRLRSPTITHSPEPFLFAAGRSMVVPAVSFDEALRDITTREPRLAQSADEVSALYAERHAFALAQSADLNLTKAIQSKTAELAGMGALIPDAADILSAMTGFTRNYAETVYRTNLSTAWSAGRMAMAADPEVSKVIGAFRLSPVGDSSTRKNHKAGTGLIASQFDPIWDQFSPPLGYNCRCALRLVDRWELKSRGLLDGNRVIRFTPPTFNEAHPDPGFGNGRPDRRMYDGRTG